LQGILSLPVPGQGTRGAVGAEPVRLADEPGPLPPKVHHRHGPALPVGEAVLKRVRGCPAVLTDQPDPCLQRALCPAVGELPPPPHVHTPRPSPHHTVHGLDVPLLEQSLVEGRIHQAHGPLPAQGRDGVTQGPPRIGDPQPALEHSDLLGAHVPAVQVDPDQFAWPLHSGDDHVDLAAVPPVQSLHSPQPRRGRSGHTRPRAQRELGGHGQATQPFRGTRPGHEAAHHVNLQVRVEPLAPPDHPPEVVPVQPTLPGLRPGKDTVLTGRDRHSRRHGVQGTRVRRADVGEGRAHPSTIRIPHPWRHGPPSTCGRTTSATDTALVGSAKEQVGAPVIPLPVRGPRGPGDHALRCPGPCARAGWAKGRYSPAMPMRVTVAVLVPTMTALGAWAATLTEAETLCLAVRRVGLFLPTRVACLEESVGTVVALALRGRHVVWCHGVSGDPIEFHAWLRTQKGEPIAQPPSTSRFLALLTIPHTMTTEEKVPHD